MSLRKALPYQKVDTSFISSDKTDTVFCEFCLNTSFLNFVLITRTITVSRSTQYSRVPDEINSFLHHSMPLHFPDLFIDELGKDAGEVLDESADALQ